MFIYSPRGHDSSAARHGSGMLQLGERQYCSDECLMSRALASFSGIAPLYN